MIFPCGFFHFNQICSLQGKTDREKKENRMSQVLKLKGDMSSAALYLSCHLAVSVQHLIHTARPILCIISEVKVPKDAAEWRLKAAIFNMLFFVETD